MNRKEELAERVRAVVAHRPGVTERAMFGGIGFMLNGNMFAGVSSKGALMARYGKADEAAARNLPGAGEVDFDAKRMGAFLVVGLDALEGEDHLEAWLAFCLAFAGSLPPKVKAD